jgi:hypothetical protein
MAVGITPYLANKILDHLRGGTAWSQPAGLYIKLHTGDPGATGVANAAGNTTRQQGTFGTAASGGGISNTVAVTWTNVSTTETYSHGSYWDASTAGNCLWTGAFTVARAVTAGGDFTIPIGDADLNITVAS